MPTSLEFVYEVTYKLWSWKSYGLYKTKEEAMRIAKNIEKDGMRVKVKRIVNRGYI